MVVMGWVSVRDVVIDAVTDVNGWQERARDDQPPLQPAGELHDLGFAALLELRAQEDQPDTLGLRIEVVCRQRGDIEDGVVDLSAVERLQ